MAAQTLEAGLGFVSLEITGRCQLSCEHCYCSSSPLGTHGTMEVADWRRVIRQAAAMGVQDVQMIGGEATLHPELPSLIRYALEFGLEVEIFTNLYRVSPTMWDVFSLPRVRLAASYYSTDPAEHDSITGRPGSHARTLANIRETLRRGIRLRAGVIDMRPGQRAAEAAEQLKALGVARIDYDGLRQLGRGVRERQPGVDQLCGGCGDRRLAVAPTGEVWPCPMARWIPLGDVGTESLYDIYWRSADTRRQLQAQMHPSQADDDDEPEPDGGCTAPLCCDPHFDQKK